MKQPPPASPKHWPIIASSPPSRKKNAKKGNSGLSPKKIGQPDFNSPQRDSAQIKFIAGEMSPPGSVESVSSGKTETSHKPSPRRRKSRSGSRDFVSDIIRSSQFKMIVVGHETAGIIQTLLL